MHRLALCVTAMSEKPPVQAHNVFWGSHGCDLPAGHVEPCACWCCKCADHERDQENEGCVARWPWYGPETNFYGEGTPVVPEGWVVHRHDEPEPSLASAEQRAED